MRRASLTRDKFVTVSYKTLTSIDKRHDKKGEVVNKYLPLFGYEAAALD